MSRTTVHQSGSPEATERIAEELAEGLTPGTTVGLVGPLGAGKTCFVRGLARGLGVPPDDIASPTFVYLVEYGSRAKPLYHADLYRFGDLAQTASEDEIERTLESIGLFEAMDSDGVCAVEWWQFYRGPTPKGLVVVEFSIENVDDRSISLSVS
jgi:tRNA threonylcarbamoyladenosine biosynthesis protein TsaE